jgi:hypothetical protein
MRQHEAAGAIDFFNGQRIEGMTDFAGASRVAVMVLHG